ncbi:unnamed protein product [Amoebophrya sp. A25]|nr:unnamed protein product [Amoebophrya sp. A25]|eukprot:GSA25T00010546001.1
MLEPRFLMTCGTARIARHVDGRRSSRKSMLCASTRLPRTMHPFRSIRYVRRKLLVVYFLSYFTRYSAALRVIFSTPMNACGRSRSKTQRNASKCSCSSSQASGLERDGASSENGIVVASSASQNEKDDLSPVREMPPTSLFRRPETSLFRNPHQGMPLTDAAEQNLPDTSSAAHLDEGTQNGDVREDSHLLACASEAACSIASSPDADEYQHTPFLEQPSPGYKTKRPPSITTAPPWGSAAAAGPSAILDVNSPCPTTAQNAASTEHIGVASSGGSPFSGLDELLASWKLSLDSLFGSGHSLTVSSSVTSAAMNGQEQQSSCLERLTGESIAVLPTSGRGRAYTPECTGEEAEEEDGNSQAFMSTVEGGAETRSTRKSCQGTRTSAETEPKRSESFSGGDSNVSRKPPRHVKEQADLYHIHTSFSRAGISNNNYCQDGAQYQVPSPPTLFGSQGRQGLSLFRRCSPARCAYQSICCFYKIDHGEELCARGKVLIPYDACNDAEVRSLQPLPPPVAVLEPGTFHNRGGSRAGTNHTLRPHSSNWFPDDAEADVADGGGERRSDLSLIGTPSFGADVRSFSSGHGSSTGDEDEDMNFGLTEELFQRLETESQGPGVSPEISPTQQDEGGLPGEAVTACAPTEEKTFGSVEPRTPGLASDVFPFHDTFCYTGITTVRTASRRQFAMDLVLV